MSPCTFLRRSKLALIGALALVAWSAAAQSPVVLPKPSGQFAVGRTALEWRDSTRANRPIQAVLWYPSQNGGTPAPYYGDLKRLLNDPVASAELKDLPGVKLDTLTSTLAHSFADAKPAKGRFPLILFSPGLGISPYLYSTQLEDLASHGYVVAGLSHPGDTGSFVLKSGEIVRSDDQFWDKHPADDANVETYKERAQLAAKDVIFAIATLKEEKRSPIAAIIDFTRMGAFGHSQGGRVAADICQLDSSVRVCINEDGTYDEASKRRPYWSVGDSFAGSFAMLDWFDPGLTTEDFASMHTDAVSYARSRLAVGENARSAYERVKGRSCRITLLRDGTRHTSFTDLKLLSAKNQSERTRAQSNLQAISAVLQSFLDGELNGNSGRTSNSHEQRHDVVMQCFSKAEQKPRR